MEEYSLSKSPPRIDALILKKNPQVKLKKKIGQIFRGYNIIEYKSPEDSLNINDFYKVYGYTCFYQSNTEKVREINPTDLTITFVCNHYPREMFQYLEQVRGMKIKDQGSGIYYLTGDPFPIQFCNIPKLSKQENYWIQALRNDLKAGNEIRGLMEKYEKKQKIERLRGGYEPCYTCELGTDGGGEENVRSVEMNYCRRVEEAD